MLLTDHERASLAAFVSEATTDPFQGPATAELHRHDIYYSDLPHLLAAYYGEHSPNQQGFGGKPNPTPPAWPWPDRDTDLRRDQEVEVELDRIVRPTVS